MKKIGITILILLLIKGFSLAQTTKGFAVSANQQTQTATGKTYAIVVGISNYKFVHPLNYATDDAILFYQFLRSKAGGNIPEENIRLLTDEEATAANIYVRSLSWLKQKNPAPGDNIIFYFSGHGDAVDANESYFLAYDANPAGDKNNYAVTGTVDIGKLKNRIQEYTTAKVNVTLIIDACRTDDIPGGKQGLADTYQSIIEKPAGELLFLSCSPNEVSYEDKRWGNGHGVFTWYLINGLAGKADADSDGKVTADELQDYVIHQVKKDTKTLGNIQTPCYCCNMYNSRIMSQDDKDFTEQISKDQVSGADNFSTQLLAARNANDDLNFKDSALRIGYFAIKKLCKEGKFLGNNSADSVFSILQMKYSEDELQPVKDYYVSKLLDEAQIAINIILIKPDFSESQSKNYYEIHCKIMKKAMDLIGDSSAMYYNQLYPRYLYLKAQKDLHSMMISVGGSDALTIYFNDSIFHDITPLKNIIKTLNHSINLGYNYPNTYASIAEVFESISFSGLYSDIPFNVDDSISYYASIANKKAPKWVLPYKELSLRMDYGKAEIMLQNLLKTDTNNIPYLNALGDFYHSREPLNNINARYYYQKSFSLNPSQPEVFFYLRDILMCPSSDMSHPFIESKNGIDSVINLTDYYFQHRGNVMDHFYDDLRLPAYCYIKKKRYNELLMICNDELTSGDTDYVYPYLYVLENDIYKNKEKADSLFIIGYNYRNTSGYGYEIPSKGHGADFYAEIANIYNEMGDSNKCEEILKKGVTDFPNNQDALRGIINYYYAPWEIGGKHLYNKALPYFQQLVKLCPAEYYRAQLGNLYLSLKDTISAVNLFMDVPDSVKNTKEYFLDLAHLYAQIKKPSECIPYLSKAIHAGEKLQFVFQRNDDSLYLFLDNNDEFTKFINQVDTSAYMEMVYYDWKDYSKAIEVILKYLNNHKDKNKAYDISCCYSLKNDKENAIKYLETSILYGYNDYEHIQVDTDLDNIRNSQEFKDLMKKYFQDKVK